MNEIYKNDMPFNIDGVSLLSSGLSHQDQQLIRSCMVSLVGCSRPVENVSVLRSKFQVGSDAYEVTKDFLVGAQVLLNSIKKIAYELNHELVYFSSIVQCIPSLDEKPRGIPWHQDVGEGVDFREVVNFVYYPQATSKLNGVFKYLPLSNEPYSLSGGDGFEVLPDEVELPSLEGDIVVSDGRLIHCVTPNSSDSIRLSFVIRYIVPRIKKLPDLDVGVYRYGKFNYKNQREE